MQKIETLEDKQKREAAEHYSREVEQIRNRERLTDKVTAYRNEIHASEAAAEKKRSEAQKITAEAEVKARALTNEAEEIEARIPRIRQRLTDAERELNTANLAVAKPSQTHKFIPSILGQ